MKIIENRHWTAADVRSMCIRENLYTMGDCEDYENMLATVSDQRNPTLEDIYWVAEDIYNHSEVQTITSASTSGW